MSVICREEFEVVFAAQVVAWQADFGRHHLPWQQSLDPYWVWLSEVMLQQTQVATVLPYFTRFVDRFPTVQTLSNATEDDVLALWSGLGYYSRARNLHRCAQVIVRQYGGVFPRNAELLCQLPGIGRTTAAAIAAFCFGQRVAIMDGNVKRLLSRVLAFEGDLSSPKALEQLWLSATQLLPKFEHHMPAYTQGLMDLGATVCRRTQPACLSCPLDQLCLAHQAGNPRDYPKRSRKLTRSKRSNVWLILRWGEKIWFVKRPAKGVWAKLWSWPEFDNLDVFAQLSSAWPGAGHLLPPVQHTLTHFDWLLQPICWYLPENTTEHKQQLLIRALGQGCWMTQLVAQQLALPAPLRHLLATQAALDCHF